MARKRRVTRRTGALKQAVQLVQAKRESQQAAFLEAFQKVGNVSTAAKISQVTRERHYEWIDDPLYLQKFLSANEAFNDSLEQEMFRRGVVGVDKPIIYMGKQALVAKDPDDLSKGYRPLTIKEYDTQCLLTLAKGRMPKRYGRNEDPFGGDRPDRTSPEERERLLAELDSRIARTAATLAARERAPKALN